MLTYPQRHAPAQLTWLVCQGAFPGMAVRTVDCSRVGLPSGAAVSCGLARWELSWLPFVSEELRSSRIT